MKKKSLLVLLPALAMVLAGCNNNNDDDHSSDSSSTSQTTGGSDSTGGSGSGSSSSSGESGLPEGVTEADFGTASAPITLAQAKALIDKLGLGEPEESATVKFEKLPIYLKGTVTSNSALADGQVNFLNMKDGDIEFTGMYSVFADGVTGYDAQNSMAGKKATVKGYGALYKKSGAIKYELVKANSERVTILNVEDSGEHHAEPAKLAKTLQELTTIAPGRAQAYTSTAKIKSWADNKGAATSVKTKYGNMILEDDGGHELYVYGASATASILTWNDSLGEYNAAANPQDFLTNGLTSTLVPGDSINFWGVVYTYGSLREADIVITEKVIPQATGVEFKAASYEVLEGNDLSFADQVNILPAGATGTVEFSVTNGTGSATMDEGTLHATSAGDVTVTATLAGSDPVISESVTVTITAAATGDITDISLDHSTFTLWTNPEAGEDSSMTIHATVEPEVGREEALAWKYLDVASESIVDIEPSSDGLSCEVSIHAGAKSGTANLRAYAANHESAMHYDIQVTVDEHINYGTAESPLSVAEALALVNEHVASGQQTAEKVYMRGVIKSNGAWSTQYSNFNNGTVLADADNSAEITAWQVTTTDTTKQLGENALKGYTATVYGNIENGSHGIQFVGKGASALSNFVAPSGASAITGFELNFSEINLDTSVNTTKQLAVETVLPLNASFTASDVTWASDDDTVASVDANGLVTAVGAGDTQIKVTINEITVACDVSVSASQSSYTLNCPAQDGNVTGMNNYAAANDVVVNGITWNAMGNLTFSDGWAFGGGKKAALEEEARLLYTKTALPFNASKITLNVGSKGANLTVDSIHVGVYSTSALASANGTGDVADFTKTYVANSAIVCTKADSTSWENCYICIAFVVSCPSGSNLNVKLTSVVIEK